MKKHEIMKQMEIREKFSMIKDLRHPSYIDYPLSDVLIIIMSAVLCGLDQLCQILTHAQNRAEFFREKFGIEKIPSKPTLSRVLNLMNGSEVSKVIIEIMKERTEIIGNIIAVDGKAIRRTTNPGSHSNIRQKLPLNLIVRLAPGTHRVRYPR